jgi:hypothetical protein
MTEHERLHTRIAAITTLDEATIARMEAIRYAAIPTLADRTQDEDLTRFRQILRDFNQACLFVDGTGTVDGFMLVGQQVYEWEGRHFVWLHIDDLFIDAHHRGGNTVQRAWLRVAIGTRLRHLGTPVYGMAPAFPGTFIDLADSGRPVYLWGEEGQPPWLAGMLDYMAPVVGGDHGVDPTTHTVQLAVTTASKVPDRFTSERHRQAFARFERAAPEWRDGRVPIAVQQVTVRNVAATVAAAGVKSLRRRRPRASAAARPPTAPRPG